MIHDFNKLLDKQAYILKAVKVISYNNNIIIKTPSHQHSAHWWVHKMQGLICVPCIPPTSSHALYGSADNCYVTQMTKKVCTKGNV